MRKLNFGSYSIDVPDRETDALFAKVLAIVAKIIAQPQAIEWPIVGFND